MAVDKVFQSCGIAIKVQVGVNEKGVLVMKNVHFSGVQAAVSDQDLYDAGVALAGLQKHAFQGVARTETFELISR